MKEKLRDMISVTMHHCIENGALADTPTPDFVIEKPNNPDHGHFATNLPMALASSQKKAPREIASIILDFLVKQDDFIEKAEIAGPGFINFWIHQDQWCRVLETIIDAGDDYGRKKSREPEKVLVEFVSANPTGPLHLGHGRGAAFGDTLCRMLSFCGFDVSREFYINDAGRQITLLGESVYSRVRQREESDYPFPEDGYHGDYIHELAEILAEDPSFKEASPDQVLSICSTKGKEIMLREIQEDMARFRVSFDTWTSESELVESGLLQKTLDALNKRGQLYKKEGAVWIRTSDFGDDKDRVIRKKDGQFTYFASDIAYHLEKVTRGFSRAINIWGADHHGYIPRVQAALSAQGCPKAWLSVILIQLVKLWQGGKEIKMSKRAGDFVTLKELVDEVGVDAVRFVFLSKSHDSPLDFDIDLVKKQDSENPVYYVQYAHARICSIFKKAGIDARDLLSQKPVPLNRLRLEEEMSLIRLMGDFPSLLEDITKTLEPHRLTYYLSDLAAHFHRYFNMGNKNPEYRIVVSDEGLSSARLFLAGAVRTVIANGLTLLGIASPEKM